MSYSVSILRYEIRDTTLTILVVDAGHRREIYR